MLNECNTCHEPISWNKAQREKLGIRGPLNKDEQTAHYCYARVKDKEMAQTQTQTQTKTPQQNDKVVTTATVTPAPASTMTTTDSLSSLTQEDIKILKAIAQDRTYPYPANYEKIAKIESRVTVIEDELRKLKEWLSVFPLKRSEAKINWS